MSYPARWSIKGIVTNKTNIHHYGNARGEDTVFSFDLLDSTNEIRITAFNNDCNQLHPIMGVGQVGIADD
jgi:replication factor A1